MSQSQVNCEENYGLRAAALSILISPSCADKDHKFALKANETYAAVLYCTVNRGRLQGFFSNIIIRSEHKNVRLIYVYVPKQTEWPSHPQQTFFKSPSTQTDTERGRNPSERPSWESFRKTKNKKLKKQHREAERGKVENGQREKKVRDDQR